MIFRNSLSSVILAICIFIAALCGSTTNAFTTSSIQSRAAFASSSSSSAPNDSTTALNQFGKKKSDEDLSYIESRDLTREEMLEINKRNEEVMNNELVAMTGISVLFSLPIFYLCWIAFFSD